MLPPLGQPHAAPASCHVPCRRAAHSGQAPAGTCSRSSRRLQPAHLESNRWRSSSGVMSCGRRTLPGGTLSGPNTGRPSSCRTLRSSLARRLSLLSLPPRPRSRHLVCSGAGAGEGGARQARRRRCGRRAATAAGGSSAGSAMRSCTISLQQRWPATATQAPPPQRRQGAAAMMGACLELKVLHIVLPQLHHQRLQLRLVGAAVRAPLPRGLAPRRGARTAAPAPAAGGGPAVSNIGRGRVAGWRRRRGNGGGGCMHVLRAAPAGRPIRCCRLMRRHPRRRKGAGSPARRGRGGVSRPAPQGRPPPRMRPPAEPGTGPEGPRGRPEAGASCEHSACGSALHRLPADECNCLCSDDRGRGARDGVPTAHAASSEDGASGPGPHRCACRPFRNPCTLNRHALAAPAPVPASCSAQRPCLCISNARAGSTRV